MQLVTFPWQPMLVASKLEGSPVGGSNRVADKVNVCVGISYLVLSMIIMRFSHFSSFLNPEQEEPMNK